MKIYLVGGAVRDELMGETPKDLDYVVVGSSPEEMLSLGYKQVGSNFPVFLHPETGDEYALARTEKSTGEKYGDFDCYFGKDVTLKDDLYRRDLTINAIAKDLDTGEYVDPFNGTEDINNKVLRNVSDFFEEDPVRVLRVLRFVAVLGDDWAIADKTICKINSMRKLGALCHLTPERVWKEAEKALKGKHPGTFFTSLSALGMFPEVKALWETPQNEEHHPEGNVGIHTMMVVNYAAQHYSPVVVFAGLCHDFGKPVSYKESGNALQHEIKGLPVIKAFCEKWKVPNNYRDLALMTCEHHTKVHGCLGRGSNKAMRAKSIMKLFTDTNALAKPLRFFHMLSACEADAKGRGGDYPNKPYKQKDYLLDCLAAAKGVNTKEITLSLLADGKSGVEIGEAVRIARIDAIRNVNNKIGTQNG
jgi:tRNA nucleotidyltransferase (CCA-adding enzyme)